MTDVLIIVDFDVRSLDIIRGDRVEFVKRMRQLYDEIVQQYRKKQFAWPRAEKIARKVVFRICKMHKRRISLKELTAG